MSIVVCARTCVQANSSVILAVTRWVESEGKVVEEIRLRERCAYIKSNIGGVSTYIHVSKAIRWDRRDR